MASEHIINISGGKDSTALYLLAIERGRPFRAVWADNGHEHPLTVEYIRTLPQRTGGPEIERVRADFTDDMARKRRFIAEKWPQHGVPEERVRRALELMQPTGHPFIDLTILKGRFPSTRAQFCTDELKIKPIERQVILPALERGNVIQWLGVRREESKSRANTPRVRRVRWVDPADRTLVYFCPMAFWGWNAVFWMHDRHSIQPNPLYAKGARRVGCWPCIHAGKAELAMIQRLDPEAVERLMDWEDIVADASKKGVATFFGSDKTPEGAAMAKRGVPGDGDERYPRADVVFQWSQTSRGGKQYDAFADACISEYGMCE